MESNIDYGTQTDEEQQRESSMQFSITLSKSLNVLFYTFMPFDIVSYL